MNRNILITGVYIIIILIASIFGFYFGFKSERVGIHSQPRAVKGIIDFSKTNFDIEKFARLKGEYAFYWNQLLTPEDLNNNIGKLSGYIHVPGVWNGFEVDGNKLKGEGYATYHLKIKVGEDAWYGIKIKEFDCAYKMWVNGTNEISAGNVSKNKKEEKPSWRRKQIYFTTVNKEIDIVLQISNFQHRKGGAEDVIIFGPAENIIAYKNQELSISLFLFGILIIMSIYHLVLYIYRRKDPSIIWFSVLCFVMTLRLLTTGEKILLEMFNNINWAFAVRIEYLSYMLAVPLFVGFVHSLFPNEIKKWALKAVVWVAAVFSAIVIFFPIKIFSYTPIVYQIWLTIAALYVLGKLICAMIQKRENSFIIFGGYFFFFLVIINDLLYYNKFLETSFLIPFGLLVLVLTQAFVLSRSSSKAFLEVENLTGKLNNYNQELEKKVTERTGEIVKQKEEIEKQKGKIEKQAHNLAESNEKLIALDKFKESLAHMMVHDLKNPLSTIIGYSALEPNEKNVQYIHNSGKQMLDLVTNILDVNKYQNSQMQLNTTKEMLCELANEAFEKIKPQIIRKDIEFINEIKREYVALVDKEIILRVFQNIFSNAIKYILKEGFIRVYSDFIVDNNKEFFKIFVYNSGENISADKLESVFEMFNQIDPKSSGVAYSTGIGLTFCRIAINAHDGQIGVLSGKEKGVTIWFTLNP